MGCPPKQPTLSTHETELEHRGQTGTATSPGAQPQTKHSLQKEDKVTMSLPSSGRSREDHRERRGVAQALWDRADSS